MTLFDTIIRNGRVLTPSGLTDLDLAITDGRIADLLPRGEGEARETIAADGRHVLPGAIDIHFHIRAPAFPHRGTVETETRAAAAGGITTLFEMPISKPCCNTAEQVEIRRAHFAEHAFIDFGLYGAPGDVTDRGIRAMQDAGVVAFKMFTTAAPPGRDDEFSGLSFPDEADQLAVLKAMAKTGLPVVVHAESAQLIADAEAAIAGHKLADAAVHNLARPAIAEAVAVAKLLTMNMEAGARLHIAHVTSAQTVEVLRAFAGTSDFSAETCPHYLIRTAEDVARVGVFAKINPPIRDLADQEALWAAIAEGIITHVTTDHAAFGYAEKQASSDNFLLAPAGTPGSEVLVPAMLDAVAAGRLSLEQMSRLLSANAAQRFGLPDKGQIAIGQEADVIIVDLDGETRIERDTLHTFARDVAQLYYGARFRGGIERTLVRGRTVYDGSIIGEAGWGRYTPPAAPGAATPSRRSA